MRSIDPGQVNYAVSDVCIKTGRILRWWILGGIKGTRACAHLCAHLDGLSPLLPGAVLVERQSRKSGAMTAIKCWTEAYYESRGVRVHPVAAKLKSNVLTDHVVTDYRTRKRAAVAVAAARIPDELHAQWLALKKKDDVGDAAAMAWAWLRHTKGIAMPAQITR